MSSIGTRRIGWRTLAIAPVMKELAGRLIGYLFIGSFCIAGPVLLMLALGTAVQRAALVMSGMRAEAVVIAERASGSSRVTYAPVFQFAAADGRAYTVISDVYGEESAVHFGSRLRVLYWPSHPESARIDAFAPLWTLPLVLGAVGFGFSVVPAIVLVSWMRRRAEAVDPGKREAARIAADRLSRGLWRALGIVLIGVGSVFLVKSFGIVLTGSSFNGSHVPDAILGALLIAIGVQAGRWVAADGRLSFVFAGIAATSIAALFGWVAVYGSSAGFHGGMSAGGRAVTWTGSPAIARTLFAGVSILAGLVSAWSWKQLFRSRR